VADTGNEKGGPSAPGPKPARTTPLHDNVAKLVKICAFDLSLDFCCEHQPSFAYHNEALSQIVRRVVGEFDCFPGPLAAATQALSGC